MPDAADRLLARLREFATTLDGEERVLLASLLAPALATVFDVGGPGGVGAGGDEVVAFDVDLTGADADAAPRAVRWPGPGLPTALVEAVRRTGLRVVGLE